MTQFAIAFPGQGSQTVGMLAELAEQQCRDQGDLRRGEPGAGL